MDGQATREPVAADRLAGVELFSDLSDDQRAQIATQMRLVRVPVGEVLVQEGDLPSKFFVILDGAMTVHRDGHHLADLGPGDVAGETGAVGLLPRNATVIATLPSEIAVLMGWDLRALLDEFPSIKERADAVIAARAANA